MRHFSLLKLLTFSSFTSTDSLLQVQLQPSGTRTTSASGSRGPNVAAATHFGRGHRLHKSIEAAAVSPQKSETHTSTNIDSANDNAKSISTSTSRRRALGSLVDGSIALLATGSLSKSAQALDMDSFINAQVRLFFIMTLFIFQH